MLRLTYTRKQDKYQKVSLLGDAEGIRDLYWQLTHNYKALDGTAIGRIQIFDLEGQECTASIMTRPHAVSMPLSTLEK